MSSLFTYTPESVEVLVAGIIRIEGFVDGTFIDVSKDEMPFKTVRTADGTVTRLFNNAQTYTITLTLHCGSTSNDLLTKLWQLDEISQLGKFPLIIKDYSGSDLLFSTESWIESVPSISKSSSVDSRVWVIRSANAMINVGSNTGPSGLIDDIINMATSAIPGIQGIL